MLSVIARWVEGPADYSKTQVEVVVVNARRTAALVAGADPLAFRLAHIADPLLAGAFRQAHPFGKRRHRDPAVLLQFCEYFTVNPIQIVCHSALQFLFRPYILSISGQMAMKQPRTIHPRNRTALGCRQNSTR